MNGSFILSVINDIAATSSRSDKEAIIARHADDPLFRKVLDAALNPFTTYGVAKLPEPAGFGQGRGSIEVTHSVWALLAALSTRTYTGNAALEKISDAFEYLDSDSAELLRRMLSKDLRAGITAKTVNKVIKELIPTFDCMLAHKFEAKRIKTWPAVAEPKLDGVRVLTFVNAGDGSVTFYSRSGREYTGFEHLREPVIALWRQAKADLSEGRFNRALPCAIETLNMGQFVLDAEVVSGSFNETVSSVRKKDEQAEDAELHCFDIVPLALFEQNGKASKHGYVTRRQVLEGMIPFGNPGKVRVTSRYYVHNEDEALAFYTKFRDRGLEGAIIKPADGKYERKRSYGWLKMKAADTEDLRIRAAFEGEGKYVGMLGGLIVTRQHNGEPKEVRVGGGFSDAQRAEFWEAFKRDQEYALDDAYDKTWELLGRLIEVEYHEVTPDGSLRHPRFVRFRDDKDMEAAA